MLVRVTSQTRVVAFRTNILLVLTLQTLTKRPAILAIRQAVVLRFLRRFSHGLSFAFPFEEVQGEVRLLLLR